MREIPKDVRGPILQRTHVHVSSPRTVENSARLSVQEWTGRGWEIVEVLEGSGGAEPSPLDEASFPGLYVGQRVVTA
jgi:hypothetical protein